MKIFGLNWAWHLFYVAVMAGVIVWGENRLNQTATVKTELGQVQQLSLPYVVNNKYAMLNTIYENTKADPCPLNERISLAAKQANGWVNAIGEKARQMREHLSHGDIPGDINWDAELLDDYYGFGDSLAALYGHDSIRQIWLERCLFSGYHDYPQVRLAAMLTASDTADAARLCQNLHLNAELALVFTLENLRKQMPVWEFRFEALLPAISYAACPRAGILFEADIFLWQYSKSENITVKVNGKSLPVEEGLARYKRTFSRPGIWKIPVEILVQNPLNGEFRSYKKEFLTEVSDTTEVH